MKNAIFRQAENREEQLELVSRVENQIFFSYSDFKISHPPTSLDLTPFGAQWYDLNFKF